MGFRKISACRVSGSEHLIPVLDLGIQALTGVFPKSLDAPLTSGPLRLVWCPDSGLLQLQHSYDPLEMYGENYGYRSGLNRSMIEHLESKARFLRRVCPLSPGDVVLDVGSNDGTLLRAYDPGPFLKVGIDPTGEKFREFYDEDVDLITEFFSARVFREKHPGSSAKIITSVAMFYDLESPVEFVRDIDEILDEEGIWHFEQSYMPSMLRTNSYDTVCHEHLEYYSLSVVRDLLDRFELRLIDVQMNSVNGGSFAVTAARRSSSFRANDAVIEWLLGQEQRMGLHTPEPFRRFENRVFQHREDLTRLVRTLIDSGKTVMGYGASTKGNVLLQFCGFTPDEIPLIAEVNEEKFGAYTPGTGIPIASEAEVRAMKPDYLLVLPWHFKSAIVQRESEYLSDGGNLIFPLPEIEIV